MHSKRLDYFTIEEAYGGSQDWFTNVVMNIARMRRCDCLRQLYLLCPPYGHGRALSFDKMHLNKEEYKQFSQIMKPYIRPRVGGVKKLEWYMEGFQRYIQDVNDKTGAGIQDCMEGLKGSHSYEEAAEKIRRQIDAGLPVPYLMLRHKNVDSIKTLSGTGFCW